MNPGQFNRRIKFYQITSTESQYGGSTPVITNLLTTWGSLKPFKQYNQNTLSGDATPLLGDITCIIRYRDSFAPAENMLFRDVSDPANPGPLYSIKAISSYFPGTKLSFENNQETVYQSKLFVFMVGVKQDNSYLNLVS